MWPLYEEHQNLTSTANQTNVATVWNYLESDNVKGLTAGLAIPIIIFLIEYQFKIKESYEKRKQEKLDIKMAQRKEKRLEIIEKTSKMWNKLYGLSIQVGRYEKKQTNEKYN